MLYLPPQKLFSILSLILVLIGMGVVFLPDESRWHDALQVIFAVGLLLTFRLAKKGYCRSSSST